MPDVMIKPKKDDNKDKPYDGQAEAVSDAGLNDYTGDAVPEAGKPPATMDFDNFADKEETVAKALSFMQKQYNRFDGQQARMDFVEELGTMDIADRMMRVGLRRDTSSAQHQQTLSDVASTMFFKQTRALHANLKAIFLEQKDAPAIFEPEINSNDYNYETGKRIANYHNMLEQYTFDEDKRNGKIDKMLWLLCKYGQVMVSDEWGYEKRKIKDNAEYTNALTGEKKVMMSEIEKIVKNWPELLIHDLKDCWFDASISEMKNQRCVIIRKMVPYEKLIGEQECGFVKNIDKIKTNQLWDGVDDEMDNRNVNADTEFPSEPNGLFSEWHAFMRVPITDKGEWNPAKTVPQLYWATFVGNMEGEMICTRLIKSPYNDGESPFEMIYLMPDDKGAYHVSLADILAPLYWQETKITNQVFDNLDLNFRSFWTADGRVLTPDLTFAPNKLVRVERGTTIQKQQVPDMTHIGMPMRDAIVKDANETVGTDKPILGQPVGGRQTATAATQVLDQAILPIAGMSSYVGDQLFQWLLRKDAMLWRQFGDLAIIKWLVGENLIEIKPSELYGDLKVKVNATGKYVNNAMYRMQLNTALTNVLPIFQKYIPESGMRKLGRLFFKMMGVENPYEYIPDKQGFDAYARAMEAARKILVFKEPVQAMPEEDHETYIAILEPLLAEYKNLPEMDSESINMLKTLIEQHRAMIKNAELMSMGTAGAGALQSQPMLQGEAIGDQAGAMAEGAVAG